MPRHFFLDRKDRIFRRPDGAKLEPWSWRRDPAVPAFDDNRTVLVMDGDCPFCSTGALRLAHADRGDRLRFVAVSSPLGQALARHFGMAPDDPETWLVLSEGRAYGDLAAYGVAGRQASGPVGLAARLAGLIPGILARPLYRLVARNRRWLPGKGTLCELPDPVLARKLL